MKQFHLYIVSVVLLLFSACGNDNDELLVGGDNTPPAALRIEVSASDFTPVGGTDTRATDNGSTTTFENGDRIGITVLDKDGNVVYNNIPYKYNGSTWSFDSGNSEGKTAVYYNNKAAAYLAYFPYSAEANNAKSKDDLKIIFPPLSDQRSKNAYRASDLLVWNQTYETPSTSLKIEFEHAYSSVLLPSVHIACKIDGAEVETEYSSTWISDVSVTLGDKPYSAYKASDGSYRIITASQSMTTSDRYFVTYRAKTYSSAMSATTLAANTCYTLSLSLNLGDYSLDKAKVGDLYCKNNRGEGYLIPGDAAALRTDANCIGIVYSTDVSRIGTEATSVLSNKNVTPHGLVMALTNASDDCRWGEESTDENASGNDGTPFKNNTVTLQDKYNNVDGYGETHWIIDTYKNNGTTLKDTYTAFYHASRYGTADSNTEKYAAPDKTTGWFIPSMGQWWDIVSNLGGIDLTSYRNSTGESATISGAAPIAVANMNKYLENIGGTTTFSTGTYFWSSSEYHGNNACNVSFASYGGLALYYSSKSGSKQ